MLGPTSKERQPSAYVILPDARSGVRAWFVCRDRQLERGPTSDCPRNLRNKMTRRGHLEVTLPEISVVSAAIVEERL